MDCRTALLTVLDQVDYTSGACGVIEMVGAVLSKEVIALARKAIADEDAQQSVNTDPPSACPACGTLPEEAEHDRTCPLASANQ